ncbi:HesA/MoeB/ThiF family protein [Sulfurirhabdus autotrophica]|uniref:Molybdopterin-synthase adenylyltransferase n=1 Tax=Sulfurirhabdus autotrophica TaxID=1706046 RepID=A0A4R3Y4Z2_9PROT|nr:molybdopterin-synthase adenylyltransferase MoeB [Sulfurirhabdus autotrophica]TCV85193.1 molybdopterin/thiamine biosynthesis adenylyltransferase [Sulfurirhabdus autotrophica]
MNDNQLLRYSRHILLPQIGIEGQEKLSQSHALIIGAGGLGSPVALYLAASGVGKLTVCDGDVVDLTNLQRQIVHRTEAVGLNKADSAKQSLLAINPEIIVTALPRRIDEAELMQLVSSADVVLDASDNFATRHAVNRACVVHKKPLVSGAAVRFDGQITVFNLREGDSPCYHCLFPETEGADEVRCAENGVFSPLVGIIGTMQAAEALKLLMGIGQTLQGRLLLLDALTMEWRSIKLKKDQACPVCGSDK